MFSELRKIKFTKGLPGICLGVFVSIWSPINSFHIDLTFYNLKFLMFVNLLRLCLRHISLLKLSKWRNFLVSFKKIFFFLSFIFKFNPSEIDFYIWCELGVQFPFLGIQIISYIGIMYWLVLPSSTNQQC